MNRLKRLTLLSLLALTGCSGSYPELGVHDGKLQVCPDSPNCVSSQAAAGEHYIKPLVFAGDQQQAQQRLAALLKEQQRVNIITIEDNYIRAEFTSAIFRFVDDVEFYFLEKSPDNTIIEVRSASRIGYSDLGANQKRIENIRSKL